MDGCWEKTHTRTHSKECTYIYTSRFIIDVVAGKWSHYDAGVSEFIHITFIYQVCFSERINRLGIPFF